MKMTRIASILLIFGSTSSLADPAWLKGFESCAWDFTALNRAVKDITPEKSEWEFSYPLKTSYMGVPVKAILLGVCGIDGNKGCGNSGYAGLELATSYDKAYRTLKKKTGKDYRDELRDEYAGATLRMRLIKSGKGVYLTCDPGGA